VAVNPKNRLLDGVVLASFEEEEDACFARRDREDNDDGDDRRDSPYSIGKRINA
jgi:hypothetical protein